jgi:hypothetical protein
VRRTCLKNSPIDLKPTFPGDLQFRIGLSFLLRKAEVEDNSHEQPSSDRCQEYPESG